MNRVGYFIFSILLVVVFAGSVRATEYTSTNFIVKDSVIGGIGGTSSSASYDLFSSGDFIFTGRSTATSFLGRFGFLYFPFVTQPILSATVGDAFVDLTWTAADAGSGFDISGYEYGISTTSGSGYTFYNVGNVTSTTSLGLTNHTTYYFIVRALDTFGNPIISSPEIAATPTDGSPPPAPPVVSSGRLVMGVTFSGHAYPGATVSILKDTIFRAVTTANAFGLFKINLQEPYDEAVLYTLYADDVDQRRSLLLNYPFVGTASEVREIKGIKFAPTMVLDKVGTKRGEPVTAYGFALPNSTIEFLLTGEVSRTFVTTSDSGGRYELLMATGDLPFGTYQLRAHYPNDTRYTVTIGFSVGEITITPPPVRDTLPGDCNADGVITITDFSVLAYWYERPAPPACIDANSDGRVDLVDFSILAYYWSE